jgi:probable rRNA maturation factor
VDVDVQGHRLPLGRSRVRALASYVLQRERVSNALLSITFVSRSGIAALNRRHLGHSGDTDVITFSLGRPNRSSPLVGDIYVAPDVVRAQARELGVPVREELARVIIHGVLHAVGLDHPSTGRRFASPMWKRQERHLALARHEGLL